MLERYKIRLKVTGPVCIGSGKQINKKDYIYNKAKDTVEVIDTDMMFMDVLQMGKEKDFERFLMNRNETLEYWFKSNNIVRTQYSKWIKYSLAAGDAVVEDRSLKEVQTFVRDAYGRPYIPGSSLKGAIRTAILGSTAGARIASEKNGKRPGNEYTSIQNNLKGVKIEKSKNYRDLDREMKKLESNVFNVLKRDPEHVKKDSAVNDFMSGIIISDSKPFDNEQLVLCQQIDRLTNGNKNSIMLRECIQPGTEIEFDLTVDTVVSKIKVSNINACLKGFIKSYYDTFAYKFDKTNNYSDNTIFLGAGTGYPTKTVMYQVLGRDGIRQVADILHAKAPKHGHKKDVEKGVAPHTKKVTQYQGMEYNMGQCEIEFEKIG